MLRPMPPVGTTEHNACCLGFFCAVCVWAAVALQASKIVGVWGVVVGLPAFIFTSARLYDFVNKCQARS